MVTSTLSKEMPLKGAVFDWDGTLVEIDERELYCINKALRAHNANPVDHDFFVKNYYQRPFETGTGPRMVLEAALAGDKHNVESVYDSYREIFAGTVDRAVLQSGALELLALLRQHGFKVGIATMRFTRAVVNSELTHLRVDGQTDVMLTREDLGFSRSLGSLDETVNQRVKLVSRVLEILGTDSRQSFLVGDSWWDIRAGKKLGMKTILTRTGFARHNDFSSEKPDYTVSSLNQLAGFVQNGDSIIN